MISCTKCGCTSNGTIAGFRPCHLRDPVEDHNFVVPIGMSIYLVTVVLLLILVSESFLQ
jgi:hypothetical protein